MRPTLIALALCGANAFMGGGLRPLQIARAPARDPVRVVASMTSTMEDVSMGSGMFTSSNPETRRVGSELRGAGVTTISLAPPARRARRAAARAAAAHTRGAMADAAEM